MQKHSGARRICRRSRSHSASTHQLHVAKDGLQQGGLARADAAHDRDQLAGAHGELGHLELKGRVAEGVLERRLRWGGWGVWVGAMSSKLGKGTGMEQERRCRRGAELTFLKRTPGAPSVLCFGAAGSVRKISMLAAALIASDTQRSALGSTTRGKRSTLNRESLGGVGRARRGQVLQGHQRAARATERTQSNAEQGGTGQWRLTW